MECMDAKVKALRRAAPLQAQLLRVGVIRSVVLQKAVGLVVEAQRKVPQCKLP